MQIDYPPVDIVNGDDVIIRQQKLHFDTQNPEDLFSKGEFYRLSHVFFVKISTKEVLLQKRSANVNNPLKWSPSASGHVDAGETYLDAAVRETREELGLNLSPKYFIPLIKVGGSKADLTPFYQSFVVLFDGNLTGLEINKDELDSVQLFQFDGITAKIESGEIPTGKRVRYLWNYYEKALHDFFEIHQNS